MPWTKITKHNYKNATPAQSRTDYSILLRFISENDVVSYRKEIGYGTSVLRFFENGGRSQGKTRLNMHELYGHPFVHHSMFYKTRSGDILFTSQPYASKEYIEEQFRKIFPEGFDLIVCDKEASWYCPGESTLFVIKLKNR